MAKYHYDKSVLKGLSVGPFLSEVKTRNKAIEKFPDTLKKFDYNANNIASELHPHVQHVVVKDIKEEVDGKTFTFVPNSKKGTNQLAYFRAGQYISLALTIGQATLNKPYSLQSDPKEAKGNKNNSYAITVKKTATGFASKYLLEEVKVGDEMDISAPLGDFYYTRLRDYKHVVAIAGGSGITPFLSMARAIVSKEEDFNLTILYGSRNKKAIMLKKELDELEKASKGKIKVVHVLSEEEVKGFENGFINAALIKKYAPEDNYSIFVCGPKAMYNFVRKEINTLKLPLKRVRFELSGEFGLPTNDPKYDKKFLDKEFKVKVLVRGEETNLVCKGSETLMSAIERVGIRVPSDCRSGKCGWCHSRLVSGKVFIPEAVDGRRAADKTFNWIHPCVSYPLSDIVIEVFPLLTK